LIDSGSSHTFLNFSIVGKLQVTLSPIPAMNVRVANDSWLPCCSEIHNFEWWIQRYNFQVNAKIIDMGAYDLDLGMDWLEKIRPMTCDWLQKILSLSIKTK
jgi:hypothetical protein